jgi:hypothetical protein
MNKILFAILILSLSFLVANENSVDCIVIKDENQIVCKYMQEWSDTENKVIFNWIAPNGKLSRSKTLVVPVGHLSVYDYRFLRGRAKGVWTLITKSKGRNYKTNFTVEK